MSGIETGAAVAGVVASVTTVVDFLDRRLPNGLRLSANKKLPPRRNFISNAPHALDRSFVGRWPELSALDVALVHPNATKTGARAAVLVGHGGVGKTTLALVYATALARRMQFEGVWVFPAEHHESLLASVETLGLALGERRPEGMLPAQWAQHVLGVVGRSAHPWLLVFDNAPSYDALRPHLPPHAAQNLRIIVTSREDGWPDRFGRVGVGRMVPEEAVALLMQETRRADMDGAASLAEALDRLPLALVIAGAYAREAQRSFAGVEAEIGALMSAAKPGDYPDKLGAVLDLTLARIEADEDTGPDELALLSLLPWLAPEGMDAKLILDIDTSKNPKAAIPKPMQTLAADTGRLYRALAALARRSLAHVGGEGAECTIVLHRITADILKFRAVAQSRDQQAAAAAVVASSYPFDIGDYRNWEYCRRLDAHARALLGAFDKQGAAGLSFRSKAACLYLFSQASVYHLEILSWEMAHAFAVAAIEVLSAIGMPDPRLEGKLTSHLAVALGGMGKIDESIVEHRKSIELCIRVPREDLELAHQFSSFSVALVDWGITRPDGSEDRGDAIREAIWYAERGHEIGIADPNCDASSKAHLLNNIGHVYEASGDHLRSMRPKKRALSALKSMPLPDELRIASAENNLGAGYFLLGNPFDAMPHLTAALQLREKHYSGDRLHPHKVQTAQWIAVCVLALDPPDDSRAREMCDRYKLSVAEVQRLSDDHMRAARIILP
jgi:tetratricopeptide (TPR) repeat protein